MIKTIIKYVLRAVFIFTLPFQYFISIFINYRFMLTQSDRIGHLVQDIDITLRRKYLGIINPKLKIILVGPTPANSFFLKIAKRHFTVLMGKIPLHLFYAILPILKKTKFYQPNIAQQNIYSETNNSKSIIKLTNDEIFQGKKILTSMGITKNDWYICFAARTSDYLEKENIKNQKSKKDFSYHSYRNCNIENYLKAAEYITSLGGFAIRMGSPLEKSIVTNNPKIIDYPHSQFLSPFMDIFLLAKCKFFLGNTSGLICIPTAFDIRIAAANHVPIPHTLFNNKDLQIPKLYKDTDTNKILSFDEIFNKKLMGNRPELATSIYYTKRNIELIENSDVDILSLCEEMNNNIDNSDFTASNEQINFMKKYLPTTGLTEDEYKYGSKLPIVFLKITQVYLTPIYKNKISHHKY